MNRGPSTGPGGSFPPLGGELPRPLLADTREISSDGRIFPPLEEGCSPLDGEFSPLGGELTTTSATTLAVPVSRPVSRPPQANHRGRTRSDGHRTLSGGSSDRLRISSDSRSRRPGQRLTANDAATLLQEALASCTSKAVCETHTTRPAGRADLFSLRSC